MAIGNGEKHPEPAPPAGNDAPPRALGKHPSFFGLYAPKGAAPRAHVARAEDTGAADAGEAAITNLCLKLRTRGIRKMDLFRYMEKKEGRVLPHGTSLPTDRT